MGYQLFTDATADVCPEMMASLPAVEFIPMEVELGDASYTYGPGGYRTVLDRLAPPGSWADGQSASRRPPEDPA